MEIIQCSDYRVFLGELLNERCNKNPALSLRSFAFRLGLSASYLSRVLSRKRNLSPAMALQISRKLKLTEQETNYFVSLTEIEQSQNEQEKTELLKKLTRRYRNISEIISLEQFKLISQWYHFAILALVKTSDFREDFSWMAERLGISPNEARLAYERLNKLGFLKKNNGIVMPLNNANVKSPEDISVVAIRENHKEQLQKAVNALDEINLELREFMNLAVNINVKDVKIAKNMIRDFINQFNSQLDRDSSDEVFQLNIQFYPLTKVKGELNHV